MKKFLLLSVVFGSLFMGCTENNPSFSGATSETTNGIAVVVLDDANRPLAQASVTLYTKTSLSAVETSISDSAGTAKFEKSSEACAGGNCFVEGIAGADSSLMSWENSLMLMLRKILVD